MRVALCIGLLAIAAGCGDDGVSINATSDNVCDQIAEVACHDVFQCCDEGEIERYLGVSDPRSEDDCRTDVSKTCERQALIAEYNASIKAKTVKFDSDTMNMCLNAVVAPSGTCAPLDMMAPWAAACMTSAWSGLVAAGGACMYPFECAGSPDTAYCAPNQTCVALAGVGQDCTTVRCGNPLYCGTTDHICHALGNAGDTCNSVTAPCAKDLYCNSTLMCAPLVAAGQACTTSAMCASDDCLPGTCAGSTQSCYTSASCSGHCTGNTNFCTTDSNCGLGTCSIGATSCSSATQCTGVGNTCVFPIACVLPACTGNIVCAEQLPVVVDYCTAITSGSALP